MADRLYRSQADRILAGVSGGLAERYGLDPSLVRITWVVLALLTGGLAIVVYVVAAFVVPEGPPGGATEGRAAGATASPRTRPARSSERTSGGLILGLLLILVGAWFLVRQVVPALDLGLIWPIIAIGAGVLLVLLAVAPRRRG